MKRTTLMLDPTLLAEAVRLTGAATYSDAVRLALRELVRRIKARQILEFAGSGVWEGDLGAVRGDRPRAGGRRPR